MNNQFLYTTTIKKSSVNYLTLTHTHTNLTLSVATKSQMEYGY